LYFDVAARMLQMLPSVYLVEDVAAKWLTRGAVGVVVQSLAVDPTRA
jgi:hypothetical protein